MHKLHQAVLALILILGTMLPRGVGAEEQPATAPATAAAQEPAASTEAPPAPAQEPSAGQQPSGQPSESQLAASMEPRRIDVSSETFAEVDFDNFIAQERVTSGDGKKLIKMAVPISFEAKMKRLPEEKPMEYVYTALEMAKVTPMPKVHHRMFVESGGGRIIPVYVEEATVAKLNAGLKEESKARFQGYHVYNYAKGPAILVVDFAAL